MAVARSLNRGQADELLALYRTMLLIRTFEEEVRTLYAQGEIPGFVHLSSGQEAVPAGVCSVLAEQDCIVSTHRGHGHCLAKGLDPAGMMAELMGRATGTCAGRAGSMHIADPDRGVLGANGIVAAGLPIAVGAAAAARQRGEDRVVVAFFGDGAVAQGAFHEALNLAALWRLPVIFVCENNGFAEFSAAETQHVVPIVRRAAAYGVEAVEVDGNDVVAVAACMDEAVRAARRGDGPRFVEARTSRVHGHYEGDPQRYREKSEREAVRLRDPIALAARRLDELDGGDLRAAIEREVTDEIQRAIATARAAPSPEPATLWDFTYRPRPTIVERTVPAGGEPVRMMDAIRNALADELAADQTVWLAGIDVGAGGNVFGVTRGLWERFPGRILDTPISETAIMGLAVGGALAGTRPVVELMYFDFIGVCLDQLMNQAAKLGYMTAGKARMSLVVRTQTGAGRSSGSQHSQSLEALLAHIPGLTVVMPSTPADAYGLLRTAIQDPNPVVFVEHRLLYGFKGPPPPKDHRVPIGKGVVRRAGTDLTLVSWSRMVHTAMEAAEQLAAQGVDAEVIDLRTVAPWDEQLVVESLEKTSRLLIAQEANAVCGIGAEIAARMAERCITALDAPVARVSPPPIPAPYAPSLEALWLPDTADVCRAALELVRY
jgi:2-oxoisovalerate dehydrogenase E1 component